MQQISTFRGTILVAALAIISITLGTSCQKQSVYRQKEKPEFILGANEPRIQGDILELHKDTVYILAANLVRNAGQVFRLEAGTIVKVNNNISITINAGGTIEAKGTSEAPIIFTSAANKGSAGTVSSSANNTDKFWYGIRIYGDVANQPSLSSGVMEFVRIEFAGGNEAYLGLPSLLFQNVSSNTVIDNIEVSYSYETPSFEFFGGNFNAYNLISYASAGTDFYIHDGYKGMLQRLLAYRHPFYPGGNALTSLPLAGLLLNGPETFPVISNLSVVGPGTGNSTSLQYFSSSSPRAAFIAENNTRFAISNSVFMEFPLAGFYLNSQETGQSLQSRESLFIHSSVQCNDTSSLFYLPPQLYPPYTSSDFKSFMLQPEFFNSIYSNGESFLLKDRYNYDINPDISPADNSPLLSGAVFDGKFADPFFEKVNYIGAAGKDNWFNGWANFKPLQTDYNN